MFNLSTQFQLSEIPVEEKFVSEEIDSKYTNNGQKHPQHPVYNGTSDCVWIGQSVELSPLDNKVIGSNPGFANSA